ncbi:pyridoxal phosphate-dependent aminotransferase [Helicobacter turcicus]|uniref:Aminotransferase n=1 Tax=Helicobacter turcicus TaxID=2867412 RepID=A0ABS7JKW0_9HELI|nr:pyridoxal phosphate-dependent aminotransferase [Helicobacter turcicus]MBX7490028.1 pyridoxal phosphate-dependent aminotransferase [Helicobacter turcicus]MBX7544887.1 pyridoxal phosphate-dependent aminotransferase [Helicobacter turcicus]
MQAHYANRVTNLSESITIAISSLARELKAQGKDILSFSAGEPDFDTPQVVKEGAIKAIQEGFTKYTATAGIPELLSAISEKLARDNNLNYSAKEIIVNSGAKHSLFNIFQALIDKDDEVIIPSPYWVTYPELVTFSNGKNVFIKTTQANNFKITIEQLKAVITPKTKMLILTTPSNPTGMVYSRQELEAIGEVLKDTNIWVLSDEIYEKLVYDGTFTSAGSISNDMLERTITVNGLSKALAMTGWRMGYLASKDQKLCKLINGFQSQSLSNINSITQKAAIVGLNGSADKDIENMRIAFKQRRDFACEKMNAIKGLNVIKPDGAFYLFVNCSAITKDSMQFCKDLLEQVGVATVPGIGFGMDGYFRFSFATDLKSIEKGIQRIADFIKG